MQYIFLCCPFRLEINKNEQSAILKSNTVHKMVCFLYKVVGLLWMIRNLQIGLPTNPKDPSMYLILAVNIDNVLLKLATAKRFWFDEQKILEIVSYILEKENDLPFPEASEMFLLKWYPGFWVMVASLVFTLTAVSHWLTGNLYFVTS